VTTGGRRGRDPRGALGASGESAVAAWYESAGYRVVDRNWRCRDGEIDLVLGMRGGIVFCEVKTRRGDRFGEPFEAVTLAKQRRLRRLAARWLSEHPGRRGAVRFDVASVRAAPGVLPVIDVIEGAF
jgi:putative endonuclease